MRPHIPCVCLPPSFVTMMTSSPSSSFPQGIQDIGFAAALRRLPQQLRAALVEHELHDAGFLEFYPRKPLVVLGLQDACTTTVLAATGGDNGAGIGYDVVPTLVLLFVISCLLLIPYDFFSSSPSLPLFIFWLHPFRGVSCLVAYRSWCLGHTGSTETVETHEGQEFGERSRCWS